MLAPPWQAVGPRALCRLALHLCRPGHSSAALTLRRPAPFTPDQALPHTEEITPMRWPNRCQGPWVATASLRQGSFLQGMQRPKRSTRTATSGMAANLHGID